MTPENPENRTISTKSIEHAWTLIGGTVQLALEVVDNGLSATKHARTGLRLGRTGLALVIARGPLNSKKLGEQLQQDSQAELERRERDGVAFNAEHGFDEARDEATNSPEAPDRL